MGYFPHETAKCLSTFPEVALKLVEEEALCNAVTALWLENQIMQLSKSLDITSMVRAEICHFRRRRILVGDIFSTRMISHALKFVKLGLLKRHLHKQTFQKTIPPSHVPIEL